VYVAEGIKMLTASNAHFGGGAYLKMTLDELIHPHIETRDPDEIVADVAARGGIQLI
jgi:hypothetical protein